MSTYFLPTHLEKEKRTGYVQLRKILNNDLPLELTLPSMKNGRSKQELAYTFMIRKDAVLKPWKACLTLQPKSIEAFLLRTQQTPAAQQDCFRLNRFVNLAHALKGCVIQACVNVALSTIVCTKCVIF